MKNLTTTLSFTLFTILMLIFANAQSQNGETYSIKQIGSNSNITLQYLDGFISSQMDEKHISGLAASIVIGDKVVFSKEFGLSNRENNIPVTDSTLFLTYSVSKMFTGISLMQLYDKALFELDDDINDYLPFDVIHPQFPETDITFRMLMNHSSGISEPWSLITSLMTEGSDSPISLHDFLENFFTPGGSYYSTSHFSNYQPGTKFKYSNVGATLAGYLTEVISGIPFNQYAIDSLLTPMNMENSSFLLADIDTNNLARPYNYSGSSFVPLPHISNATIPAGFLRSSSKQMSNYLKMLINNGTFEDEKIINHNTLDTMTTLYNFPGNQTSGLFMGYDPNYETWGHTGGLDNTIKTMIFYNKSEQWGVSLLSNGAGDLWEILYILEQYAREFSALSLSGFNIVDDNNNEIIEPNEVVELEVDFRNSCQQIFENGKVIMRYSGTNLEIIDSVFTFSALNPDEIISNENSPFKIIAADFTEFQREILEFNYYENDLWIGKESYPIYLGKTDILLIDDEEHPQRNRSQSMSFYINAFNDLDSTYYLRNMSLSPINQEFINQFKKVIWFTGISNEQSNILPDNEQEILIQYLNQGGKLFLSSQNATDFCDNSEFFTDYLKVNHVEDNWTGLKHVSGEDGDTIGNGFQFYITGGDGNSSAYSPSIIEAVDDGIEVFKYTNTTNICGVRFANNYKSLFTSFGLEVVNNANDRKELINKTLIWFDDVSLDLPKLNSENEKLEIFPNPTNGSFKIEIPSSIKSEFDITIFDISGKIISKKRISVSFLNSYYNCKTVLASGIYFITLVSNEKSFTSKIIVE